MPIYIEMLTPERHTVIADNFVDNSFSMDMNTTPLPIPEQKFKEAEILKFQGNVLTYELTWVVDRLPPDTSENTYTHVEGRSIKNPEDLRDFMIENMENYTIGHSYRIRGEPNGGPTLENGDPNPNYFKPFSYNGALTKMNFRMSQDDPTKWLANIQFVVGNVITVEAYESREEVTTPDAP